MKTIFPGLVVTALVAAASFATSDARAEGATVTISNAAGMEVRVLVGGKIIKVETRETIITSIDDVQQDIGIQTADGNVTDVHVQDGDLVVLQLDPVDELQVLLQVVNATPAKASTSLGQRTLPYSGYDLSLTWPVQGTLVLLVMFVVLCLVRVRLTDVS